MAGSIEFSAGGYLAATVATSFAELEGVALGGALETGFGHPSIRETEAADFPNPRDAALELKALTRGKRLHQLPRDRISDKDLAQVLESVRGDRKRAAEALTKWGIPFSDSGVSKRVTTAAADSPLAKFRTLTGLSSAVSNEKLAAVLESVKGNRMRASAALANMGTDLSKSAIFARIDEAPKDSPLAKFRELKGRSQPPRISDAELARVLEEAGWVQLEAVRRLAAAGILLGRSAVNKRVRRAKPGSPLYRAGKI